MWHFLWFNKTFCRQTGIFVGHNEAFIETTLPSSVCYSVNLHWCVFQDYASQQWKKNVSTFGPGGRALSCVGCLLARFLHVLAADHLSGLFNLCSFSELNIFKPKITWCFVPVTPEEAQAVKSPHPPWLVMSLYSYTPMDLMWISVFNNKKDEIISHTGCSLNGIWPEDHETIMCIFRWSMAVWNIQILISRDNRNIWG